jgi:hypothetical protein
MFLTGTRLWATDPFTDPLYGDWHASLTQRFFRWRLARQREGYLAASEGSGEAACGSAVDLGTGTPSRGLTRVRRQDRTVRPFWCGPASAYCVRARRDAGRDLRVGQSSHWRRAFGPAGTASCGGALVEPARGRRSRPASLKRCPSAQQSSMTTRTRPGQAYLCSARGLQSTDESGPGVYAGVLVSGSRWLRTRTIRPWNRSPRARQHRQHLPVDGGASRRRSATSEPLAAAAAAQNPVPRVGLVTPSAFPAVRGGSLLRTASPTPKNAPPGQSREPGARTSSLTAPGRARGELHPTVGAHHPRCPSRVGPSCSGPARIPGTGKDRFTHAVLPVADVAISAHRPRSPLASTSVGCAGTACTRRSFSGG